MLEINKISGLKMRFADNLFLYKLDDSLAWLFNIDSGECYNLNESSHFILSLFDGEKTVDEIRQKYLKKYAESGVEDKTSLEDFDELLEELIINNFILS